MTQDRLYDRKTITDIKDRAKDNVRKGFGGTSHGLLITAARLHSLKARNLEMEGDLKNALETLIKSATLTQMYMDSNASASEPGDAAVHKEFMEFMIVSVSVRLVPGTKQMTCCSFT